MKFEDKYPDASVNRDEFQEYNSTVMKTNRAGLCWNCGDGTFWVDMSFVAYLCSEECHKAKWDAKTNPIC